jgi:phage/conjugal plasmid C-4 type zinc finger TraR family protein
MAIGWAPEGAVQEQIDAGVADAVERARNNIPQGESRIQCAECAEEIPLARRQALLGVSLCIKCQSELEKVQRSVAGYNRRGSKDSQLK